MRVFIKPPGASDTGPSIWHVISEADLSLSSLPFFFLPSLPFSIAPFLLFTLSSLSSLLFFPVLSTYMITVSAKSLLEIDASMKERYSKGAQKHFYYIGRTMSFLERRKDTQ